MSVATASCAKQLADLGFISDGTLIQRYTTCGKPTCRCQADPPQRHGPYWLLTRKVDGKTLTRRLSSAEAALYEEWIANGRRLDRLVSEMRDLSRQAGEILPDRHQRLTLLPGVGLKSQSRSAESGFGVGGVENFHYQLGDLKIDVLGPVAIATFVFEYGFDTDGEAMSVRARSTMVLVNDNEARLGGSPALHSHSRRR